VAREDAAGDKRLVAYVVTAPDRVAPPASELRRFLQEELPDYMIPSVFVFLDAMPFSSGGKVDRRALPIPDQARHALEESYVAPRTPTEKILAAIWADVLGVDRIGIHDNFFEMGGHSLLAIQLISHTEQRFGTKISVAILFQYSTIAELARLLEAEALPQSGASLIPIHPEGSKVPFFWVHGDSSNILLSKYLGSDQPLYALEHQAHDGRRARYTQAETIAKHYLDEVRTVRPRGPYLLGGYSFGALIAFEMAHQLRREGEEVALLFMLDPAYKKRKEKPRLPPPLMLWEALKKHWREISQRGLREKLNCLAPKLKAHLASRISWATPHLKRLRRKCYLAAVRPLPVSLRSAYIVDVYHRALRLYMPQPYSGRVMLYRSRGACYPPSVDWLNLFNGELEVYEGAGEHLDLREEPYVAQWAQRLKASLDGVRFRGSALVSVQIDAPAISNSVRPAFRDR